MQLVFHSGQALGLEKKGLTSEVKNFYMRTTMNAQFLLLIVSLPPNPSSLRVRVWRRLRALGAVALKRTVYLLPDTPDHYELFQWLAQEIQRAGGEATLLRVEQIENMSSA